MNMPNSPPLPFSLTGTESDLCLPGFPFLDLYLLTQAPTTLAPFSQTYFQDVGFLELIHSPPHPPFQF